MKKLALILIAVAANASIASAADMAARKTYTKAPPKPVMTYNWTGCYVGGNVGGGWSQLSQNTVGSTSGLIYNFDYGSANGSAFLGGAQVGCDYQFSGNFVVGAQGMFDFGKINSQHNLPILPTDYSVDSTKYLATATARAGYLFLPQALVYVKGGGAWTKTDSSLYTPALLAESALGVSRTGYTVGGGVEYMFMPNWSVFGEYNYMDFGRKNVSTIAGPSVAPGGTVDIIATKLTIQQLSLGVNYKFNIGGPIVAKY